jgi:hypothetical protein
LIRRSLAVAALAALACASAASAHTPSGGGANPYVAAVTSITPALKGLTVKVLGGDDQLELTNETGRTIVVLGYEGEPYLRFGPSRVELNQNSPAAYLNAERFARVKVPERASATAQPRWLALGATTTYSWHDHRIHWMSPAGPPAVRAEPDKGRRVFDWKVPLRAGGERVTIAGTLDYVPTGGSSWWIYPLAIGAAIPLGVAAAFALRKRSTRHSGLSAPGRR